MIILDRFSLKEATTICLHSKKGAQWKPMCEKFPFKETKSDLCRSMLETGLEGVKGGGVLG